MTGEKNPMFGTIKTEEEVRERSKKWIAISPEGKMFEFYSLRRFCREEKLTFWHMNNVARGKELHHKRWLCYLQEDFSPQKVKESREQIEKNQPMYELYSPSGEKFVTTNLRKFSIERGLNNSCLIGVAKGQRKHHKGWKAIKTLERK